MVNKVDLSGASMSLDEITTFDEEVDENKHVEVVRPKSFSNARLTDESLDEYKERRLIMKKFMRQVKFFKSHGEDNRAKRRERKPLRLTKPLKYVRKKIMVGKENITFAIKKDIPLHQYLRVAAMGLDIKKLSEIGKELSEELRENGDNPDKQSE